MVGILFLESWPASDRILIFQFFGDFYGLATMGYKLRFPIIYQIHSLNMHSWPLLRYVYQLPLMIRLHHFSYHFKKQICYTPVNFPIPVFLSYKRTTAYKTTSCQCPILSYSFMQRWSVKYVMWHCCWNYKWVTW